MLENKFFGLEGKFEAFKLEVRLDLEKTSNKIIISVSAILTVFLAISQILNYIKG